jgi:methyl-accepting chemotaxis protein
MGMKKIFHEMRIRVKLQMAFFSTALIMIIISLLAILNMRSTLTTTNELTNIFITPLDTVVGSIVLMDEVKTKERDMLEARDKLNRDALAGVIRQKMTDIRARMANYDAFIMSDVAVGIQEFKQLTVNLDAYDVMFQRIYVLLQEGRYEEADEYYQQNFFPCSELVMNNLTRLTEVKISKGRDIGESYIESATSTLIWIVIITAVGFILIITLGLYFSITISRPIVVAMSIMDKAKSGDFTVRIPSIYGAELGELFASCNALNEYNEMSIMNFNEILTEMRGAADSMLDISSKMAVNSKDLSEQTTVVSTATEEFSAGMAQSAAALSTASSHIGAVAAAIEEINSTISSVAAAAEETSSRVNQSSGLVDSIQNSIAKASSSVTLVSDTFDTVAENVNEINRSILLVSEHSVNAMNQMTEADMKAQNTNAIIRRLEIASKQIGKIVSVISDIADQTNMLALNAAIEAAGAGEAGKGFMVVANEVKELAKQTADATDEIADQIENMQKNMPEAVGAVGEITAIINGMSEFMNSFSQEIKQQGRRSDQIADESTAAAKRMKEINNEISKISENALSVTKTVVDSAKGVNAIAKSTAELVIGTHEIAMNSERASNNISGIDRTMKEMVTGLTDISKNIQMINNETGEVQNSAGSVEDFSAKLSLMATELRKIMKGYKTGGMR